MARRKKSSLPNRLINAGLLALAFFQPLKILFGGGFSAASVTLLLDRATAGLSSGKFSTSKAAEFYGPVAAAFILFEVKKMAMKKFRF